MVVVCSVIDVRHGERVHNAVMGHGLLSVTGSTCRTPKSAGTFRLAIFGQRRPRQAARSSKRKVADVSGVERAKEARRALLGSSVHLNDPSKMPELTNTEGAAEDRWFSRRYRFRYVYGLRD